VREKLDMLTWHCLCRVVGLGQLGSRHVVGNDRFQGHSVCTLYTGKQRSWDPHTGMKPSRRHGCGSDNEVDLEVEDDLPYGAATEVNSGMVELMWDAYRNHLTRKAAEWAVRKQKSHRRIAPEANMPL